MTRDNVDLDLDTMLIIESSYLLQYFFFLSYTSHPLSILLSILVYQM